MQTEQFEKLESWFNDYVSGFYGDDDYVNASIRLKDDHCRRTREEMLYLAESLGLDDNNKRMAELIGLLHDVGRFNQFKKYGRFDTYNLWKGVP